jgi:hypothetical protein
MRRCRLLLVLLAGCAASPPAPPGVVTIPSVGAALVAPPPPARAARPHALRGVWREFWGDPATTDVMYHDLYRIDPDPAGALRLSVDGADDPIKGPTFAGDELTFTQVTTFDVRYRMRLKPDGRNLVGTATSPKGVFPVRWEKVADRPDARVPRDGTDLDEP